MYARHLPVGSPKTMKEDSIIQNIKRQVAKHPHMAVKKLWSSGTGRDIDILLVYRGLAGFYEIKVPGKKPSAWQYNRLAQWAASGADTNWFDDPTKFMQHVAQLADNFDYERNVRKANIWFEAAIEAGEREAGRK